jgi:soluble epoxide hydrolase/lipid-phosphate phosphatase
MNEIHHSTVRTNGIDMHVAQKGQGFPVVMCHGFPELWYSWRHQLEALSAAGFRAIAPDMRGYGRTDAPAEPAQYTMKTLCADMAGLLDALGIAKAVFVGHDFGGAVIWQMGLRHPERVERLVGVNTPYAPPIPGLRPTIALRDRLGLTDATFYMRYFQKPGVAEKELEADVRGNLAKIFHSYRRADDLWTFATVGGDGSGVLTKVAPGETFLTKEELDVYTREFERTGFRGPLNWYRAIDLNADEADPPKGPGINLPSMMIMAQHDRILRPEMAAHMPKLIPGVRMELIENCGHWTQAERAPEVNALLLDFLKDLPR